MNEEKNSDVERKVTEVSTDGKISCRKALLLTEKLGVSPRSVGEAADNMGVKITSCQLGCFGSKRSSRN